MERYTYFKNSNDFKSYLTSIKLKTIGQGTEGQAFLTKDNKVVKVFNNKNNEKFPEILKSEIITAQDFNVSSYYLPNQLLILDDYIVGYLSNYFPGNIMKFKAPYNGNINDIDIDNLIAAYYKMVDDTIILSEEKIELFDLTFNLLFNNQELGAIDTFNYHRDPKVTLSSNLEALDYALLCELHFHDINYLPDYELTVEENLRRIRKK